MYRTRKMDYKKYRNCSQKCIHGHWHDSKLEATYCNQLEMLRRNGDIQSYEIQVKYDFVINNLIITTHKIDFEVINKYGEKELHEVKGFKTYDYTIKRRLYEALYPDIPFFEIR